MGSVAFIPDPCAIPGNFKMLSARTTLCLAVCLSTPPCAAGEQTQKWLFFAELAPRYGNRLCVKITPRSVAISFPYELAQVWSTYCARCRSAAILVSFGKSSVAISPGVSEINSRLQLPWVDRSPNQVLLRSAALFNQ
ncbi:hypothetical protein K439DRAFT_1065246 [Ramaria rubella]|nr:hypothetical protein K439DRAFT_1065246 [Ramaria rubella]